MSNDFTYWMNIQNDRDLEARNAANQALANAQWLKDQAETAFQGNLAGARTQAQDTAQRYFSDRGLPFDQGLANSIINRVSVPDLDPNPSSYFTPDIFATGIAQSEQAQRQKYMNQESQLFTPGFEKSLLPDSSTTSIVNSILGDQKQQAQTILDYNKSRGLLNPTGYTTAENVLGQQESAGRSTLTDLANSVLAKDRTGLTDIAGEAGTLASGYNYGAPAPDFSPYQSRVQSTAATDLSGLEGSIRGALGSTNLFDVPTAIVKGGTAQGPIDLTTVGQPSASPLADQQNKKTQQRGLGTTGVF